MFQRRPLRKQFRLVGILLLLVAIPGGAWARTYTPKEEDRIGKEGCAEIEKAYKVIDDPAQLRRVDDILKVISPATPRPEVVYRPKILQTDDVNALSLPGGYIYVTKGLLDLVESDDELAGVLAHEVAHNVLQHALKGLDKEAKLDKKLMLLLLGGLLLNKEGVDTGAVLMLGQLLKQNALSGYGVKAEGEADHAAVEYLANAKRYNACGMLQFMGALEREENRRPQVEMGIFRTHPQTPLRVAAIRAALDERGIPIVRVPGKSTPRAATRTATVNGREISEVVIGERVIFQPAPAGGRSSAERAAESAQSISAIFRDFVEDRSVRVGSQGNNATVVCRDALLLTATPEDAAFHGTTPALLAGAAAKALKAVIWQDFIRTNPMSSPLAVGSNAPPVFP